jgi:hypothetical protein
MSNYGKQNQSNTSPTPGPWRFVEERDGLYVIERTVWRRASRYDTHKPHRETNTVTRATWMEIRPQPTTPRRSAPGWLIWDGKWRMEATS